MRILLVGSGGREHALAWKIRQSPLVEKLWIAPGNPGTAELGENVPIALTGLDALVSFARDQAADLVVVGPEGPLVAGLSDRLAAAGVRCFGPLQNAAEIEGSKSFCKELLVRYRIPTANYRVFSELNPAISYLEGGARYPLVVKASGLAAGKGVTVASEPAGARQAAKAMLEDGIFGAAGRTIVIEEYLQGAEVSAFILTDGRTFTQLELCQDHKTLLEGGRGPNTGGMGAISPVPQVSERTRDSIERQILLPTLHGLNHDGRRFHGILYAGLKLTPAGPKVLEFNARFGDPECEVLMLRMRSDLLPLLCAAAEGTLENQEAPEWDPRPAVTVVLASGGYPGNYATGHPIEGLDAVAQGRELQVFHCGTALRDGRLVTAGGRVLAVSALGDDLNSARRRAYSAVEQIRFPGMTYRRDIGAEAADALEALR
ncbi:MAG: phosphoribosylamine--glycine ligase [Planctomycetota bacterium]|nr:MAG: phosphoribosylamine--glycine ligase [Planctomycetota bacterium]